jgi:hypothetical protein
VGKRSGRKSEKPVTKPNAIKTDAPLKHGETWWRVLKDFLENTSKVPGELKAAEKMTTQLGRLVFVGVIDSARYEAGMNWLKVVQDYYRIVAGRPMSAKVSSIERKSPGALSDPSDAAARRASDDFWDCHSAIIAGRGGRKTWKAVWDLIVDDEHIEYERQIWVKDALTRLVAVLGGRKNKR